MLKAKLLGLVALSALVWTVGCAPPAPPVGADSAAKQILKNTHTFHIAASNATAKAYGITTWHMMLEGNSHSVVVDGSDGKGAIKFSTAFRNAKNAFHVQDYKRNEAFSIEQKKDQYLVTKNTLSNANRWSATVTAFSNDWAAGKATQEYGFFKQASTFFQQSSALASNISKASLGVAVVAGLAGPVTGGATDAVGVPAVGVAVAAYEASGFFNKAAKISNTLDVVFPYLPEVGSKPPPASDNGSSSDQGNGNGDKLNDNGLASDQANGNGNGASDPATDPGMNNNGNADQPADDNGLSSDQGNGNGNGATNPATDPSNDNGLSSDQGNGNGEGATNPATDPSNDNGLSSDQGNGNGAGAQDPAIFQPAADNGASSDQGNGNGPPEFDDGLSSDQGNGNGEGAQMPDNNVDQNLDQGGVGGGDNGGGGGSDDAEESIHKACVKVSCSKTTSVCICKKY